MPELTPSAPSTLSPLEIRRRARPTPSTTERLLAFGFEGASLARLRTLPIPKLGLDPMASWKSVSSALSTLGYCNLQYPFAIEEATARFKEKGGPMLNLLRSPRGVYLVALLVTVDGVRNKHCVMLSTLREKHVPSGKLINTAR